MSAFWTADLKLSDLSRHTDGRFTRRALEKTGNFSITNSNRHVLKLTFCPLGKIVPSGVFATSLHKILRKHSRKHNCAKNEFQSKQKPILNKNADDCKNEPSQKQELIQRIITVSSVHKL